jgi:hypothetical protein
MGKTLMLHYVYIHDDGRQAHGLSTWVAVAKALGRDQARAVLNSSGPLLWTPPRTPSVGRQVRKVAQLHGPNHQRIGTFYEMA